MTAPDDRNSDLGHYLHNLCGTDDFWFYSRGGEHEIHNETLKLISLFSFLSWDQEANRRQTSDILLLQHSLVRNLEVASGSHCHDDFFGFSISRDGDRHIQVSRGPRLCSSGDRQAADGGPSKPKSFEIGFEPGQGSCETDHPFDPVTSTRGLKGVVS
jgi:hypothetical protein